MEIEWELFQDGTRRIAVSHGKNYGKSQTIIYCSHCGTKIRLDQTECHTCGEEY